MYPTTGNAGLLQPSIRIIDRVGSLRFGLFQPSCSGLLPRDSRKDMSPLQSEALYALKASFSAAGLRFRT